MDPEVYVKIAARDLEKYERIVASRSRRGKVASDIMLSRSTVEILEALVERMGMSNRGEVVDVAILLLRNAVDTTIKRRARGRLP